MNRLQTLLSLVKHMGARPPYEGDGRREPWEMATAPLEQLELQFGAPPGRRSDRMTEINGETGMEAPF